MTMLIRKGINYKKRSKGRDITYITHRAQAEAVKPAKDVLLAQNQFPIGQKWVTLLGDV